MKLSFALTLAFCAALHAQEPTADRVVVPAGKTGQPRLIQVSTMQGAVTVKTHPGKEIIVETQTSASTERRRTRDRDRDAPAPPDGLHRVELPGRSGLEIDADDANVNIRTQPAGNMSITLTVPVDSSLKLHTLNGAVQVDGVHGELDVDALNGGVTLSNISGTVVAHSLNGPLKVSMLRVDPAKPISFSTLNGEIDVTLPPDLRANVRLKTDHGDIYSDFDLKLDLSSRGPVPDTKTSQDGRYHVRVDRTMVGTINGGGVEASFQTFNGRIEIRKRK